MEGAVEKDFCKVSFGKGQGNSENGRIMLYNDDVVIDPCENDDAKIEDSISKASDIKHVVSLQSVTFIITSKRLLRNP